MSLEQAEKDLLEKSWWPIMLIWGAMLASIGFFLVLCLLLQKLWPINVGPEFPLAGFRYALFGVSFITLFIAYFVRKRWMGAGSLVLSSVQTTRSSHPAATKYLVMVIITSALLESIGLYGLVLFFLAKDMPSVYGLLGVSAGGMIFFRPRKYELLDVVLKMRTQERISKPEKEISETYSSNLPACPRCQEKEGIEGEFVGGEIIAAPCGLIFQAPRSPS